MCRSGKGIGPGMKRLLRQPQQDRRVLADRIQHHRPLELGDDLAHDVDALGLERAQVVRGDRGGGWTRVVRESVGFTVTVIIAFAASKNKSPGVGGPRAWSFPRFRVF